MAPPHIHPNQLRSFLPPSIPPLNRHRHSTAQTCLFKILHIISVFSGEDAGNKQCLSINEEKCENRGLNVDLNISLRLPTEIEPVEPLVMAENSGDAENCSSSKNNFEICHVGDPSTGIDSNGVSDDVNRRDEGYLGLLIEAAQLILGEDESTPPRSKYVESSAAAAEIGLGTKRKQERWTAEWLSEFEGTLPALKSKRGRNLVLPEKYRDSFVEPLIRWTPAAHRSKSEVETVPSKRRSKW